MDLCCGLRFKKGCTSDEQARPDILERGACHPITDILSRQHREAWLALPVVAAVREQASPQARSVINRFALVAAALRMAIEAKLLPWTVADTDLGVAACMTRWAAVRRQMI
jgi:hypothetical protein